MSQAELLDNPAFEENLGESSPENTTCTNIEPEVKEMSQAQVLENQTVEENQFASEQTTPVATITPFAPKEGLQTGLDMEAMAREVNKLKAELDLYNSSEYAEDTLRKLVEEQKVDQCLVQADHVRFLWYLKIGTAANAFMKRSKAKKVDAMKKLHEIIGRKDSAIISYMRLAKYTDSIKFISLGLARLEDLVSHVNNMAKITGLKFTGLEVALAMLRCDDGENITDFARRLADMTSGEFNEFVVVKLFETKGKSESLERYSSVTEFKLSKAKKVYSGKDDVEEEVDPSKQRERDVATIENSFTKVFERLKNLIDYVSQDNTSKERISKHLGELYKQHFGNNDTQQNGEEQKTE